MGEELVGWVASQRIGRLSYGGYKGGYGYGLFFTNDRLVGFSYRHIVSKVLHPAYEFELFGFAIAGILATYFGLAAPRPPSTDTAPWWIILLTVIMLSSIIIAIAIFLFLGPRKIATQIQDQALLQIQNLRDPASDLSLERSNIAQVTIDRLRINIQMKTGEWFLFGILIRPTKPERKRLVDTFQQFCSLSPPINMFVKQKEN